MAKKTEKSHAESLEVTIKSHFEFLKELIVYDIMAVSIRGGFMRGYKSVSGANDVSQRPNFWTSSFAEAPEEKTAESVEEAFLNSAGVPPMNLAATLSRADGGMREHAVTPLQPERGNAYVHRMVAAAIGAPGRLVGRSQPEMVAEVVRRKGAGIPLGQPARGALEGFFGANLGHIRVHADGAAVQLSRKLHARAFTVGHDIFFSPGAHQPASREGQSLFAHELTHVAQQTGLTSGATQRATVQRDEAPEEPTTGTSAAPIADNDEGIATAPG